MTGTDLLGIVRRHLPAELSAALGEDDIMDIINRGIVELHRELGGQMTSSAIVTDADGLATLPSDCIRLHRVVYNDVRAKQIDMSDI